MKIHALIAVAALLLSSTAFAQSAPTPGLGCVSGAHTFCVTSTADTDGNVCDNSTPASICTLRQAMNAANAAGGANTIGFQIPGSGPQTITLASQLPAINPNPYASTFVTSLTIDGYSQPGSALNTHTPDQGGLNTKLMIEIVGTGNGYGFYYNCCAAPFITITLQGLNLHSFFYPIAGQSGTLTPKAQWNIYGCFIGTNLAGTAAAPGPAQEGIRIEYDSGQIGGTQAWQRNLISGNSFAGVDFGGVAAGAPYATVVIEGNLIGTDVTGTQAIPNSAPGLSLNSAGNPPGLRVGCTGNSCTAPGHPSRNVISGNTESGIKMYEGTSGYANGGTQIKGNYIGTDVTGTKPLPNGGSSNCATVTTYCGGIQTLGNGTGPALVVGGFNPGEANLIAYNFGPGIWSDANCCTPSIADSFDNQGNAIHNNSFTDIAFEQNAWIPNDPGDADTGVNNKQNYPVIQSAHLSGNQLDVTYSVDSATTNSTYPLRIDFYVDIDEGSGAYLVSDTYPASSAQMARSVTLTLPANALPLVGFVASATDANGYSSEFSPSVVFDRIFADRFEGH